MEEIMIRKNIEMKLSVNVISILKKNIYHFRLVHYYFNDTKDYLKYSFGTTRKLSFDHLRAMITLHYHSIEKGLSNYKIRVLFGQKALKNLFYVMDTYIKEGYPSDDERFTSAINALSAYVDYHKKNEKKVAEVEKKLKEYKMYVSQEGHEREDYEVTEAKLILKDEILDSTSGSFEQLAKKRVSVRDYSDVPVELQKIEKAIEIAKYTPSVCNRQPWQVYVLRDEDKIENVLGTQKGLNPMRRKKVKSLLIVTTDLQYFANDKERNEPYIDGGLFSMSLVYALQSQGLASCCLNASLSLKDFNSIKKVTNIKKSEKIIMFITVGNYLEEVRVPLSSRDDTEKFISIV